MLVARAFGARSVYIANVVDEKLEQTVKKVISSWGGRYFSLVMGVDPKRIVKEWKKNGGVVVHLTMYGLPLDEVVDRIRKQGKVLVIVGAEKVPRWVFDEADFNVAIGNQPHSEVSALAVFLDRIWNGRQLKLCFPDAKMYIVPSAKGKRVVRIS